MQSFQEGDEEAFKELVRRYKEPIIAFVARMLNNREKAMDIAQETFIRIFVNAESYRPVGGFAGWLYRIAYNLAINEIRHQKRQPLVSMDGSQEGADSPGRRDFRSPDPSAEDALLGDEQREAVRRCVAALPAKYRGAIVMKDMEGMTFEEIARILDCPESTVKSRVMRARRMLKRKLQATLAPEWSAVARHQAVRQGSGS